MNKILLVAFTLLCFLSGVLLAQPALVPQKITLKSGKTFSLKIPQGFEIIPAAEGLKRVRFFAKAPDGRMFVTDMHDLTDNDKGTIYILDEWNPQTGKFGKFTTYLNGLKNPNSVQFYRDLSGQDWIYIAETHRLTRRKFRRDETKPTGKPETIATFPDYGLSYKYGGWHLTRTIAFSPAGKLYVSVGSSCNACIEKEKVRATVLEMNPDGSRQRIFARGLRNAVSIKWIGKSLWATNQGSDHLGDSKPDETFYALKSGGDYGWPYCYQSNGRIFADKGFPRSTGCRNVQRSYAFFPAHSSAMGFDYFDSQTTDESLRNSFLVSLHGSTDESVGHGYRIVSMRKGEKPRPIIDGFLVGKTVFGRPSDIHRLDQDSFLFSDDRAGIIYLVRRKAGETGNSTN
jgi:glucose/arabinose dehydrogenase